MQRVHQIVACSRTWEPGERGSAASGTINLPVRVQCEHWSLCRRVKVRPCRGGVCPNIVPHDRRRVGTPSTILTISLFLHALLGRERTTYGVDTEKKYVQKNKLAILQREWSTMSGESTNTYNSSHMRGEIHFLQE